MHSCVYVCLAESMGSVIMLFLLLIMLLLLLFVVMLVVVMLELIMVTFWCVEIIWLCVRCMAAEYM